MGSRKSINWFQTNKKLMIMFVAILLIIGGVIVAVIGKPLAIRKDLTLSGNFPDDIKNVLYYASLAPSSHNTQNWKVKVNHSNSKMMIYLDDTRLLKEVDPMKREAYISIGAFLKNLEKAFTAYGYETIIQINENENSSEAVTVIYERLDSDLSNESILLTIEKRHTDKRAFNPTPLPEEIVNTLCDDSQILYYAKGSSEFNFLSEATFEAFSKQSNTQAKRDELAEWLRFSNSEAKELKDGLPAEQLGLTGIKKFIYYLITNRETAKGDDFAKQGIEMAKSQLDNCAGFFIITGENDKKSLILCGLKLQSFWLAATENNIAIHPMSQVLEEEPYKDEIMGNLNLGTPVQMVLRAGTVSDYGSNNKIRRVLREFVEVEE